MNERISCRKLPVVPLGFAVLAIVWGASFVAVDVGLEVVPPLLFAALRYDIAGVAVLAYATVSTDRWRPRSRDDWLAVGTGTTLLIAIYHSLVYIGQLYVSGAVASVIVSLVPVLTALLAALTLSEERLEPLQYAGIAVGFVGVFAVAAPDAGSTTGASVIGSMLVFLAAAAFAAGTVTLRKLSPSLPNHALQGWSMVGGAVLLHAGSLARGESMSVSWTPEAVGALAYLSLVAGVVAFLIYFELVERTGPSEASLVNYAQPITATVVSWLVLGTVLTATTLGGLVTILGGLALFKRRTLARLVPFSGVSVTDASVSMHDVFHRRR